MAPLNLSNFLLILFLNQLLRIFFNHKIVYKYTISFFLIKRNYKFWMVNCPYWIPYVHPCLLMFSCNLLFNNGNLAVGPNTKLNKFIFRTVSSCTPYKRNSYFSYRICKSFFLDCRIQKAFRLEIGGNFLQGLVWFSIAQRNNPNMVPTWDNHDKKQLQTTMDNNGRHRVLQTRRTWKSIYQRIKRWWSTMVHTRQQWKVSVADSGLPKQRLTKQNRPLYYQLKWK